MVIGLSVLPRIERVLLRVHNLNHATSAVPFHPR